MIKSENLKKYVFEYDMFFITILSLIIYIIMCMITYLIYRINGNEFLLFNGNIKDLSFFYVIFIIIMFFWMVLHEIIHGIFYRINGACKENITYGVVLEKGIFYCKCGEFINKKNIIMSLLAPFTLIGIITYIVGIWINNSLLIILSIINIGGAAGDLTMFFFFLKLDKELLFKELDDSTKFCLYTKMELNNKKFLGVKLIKVLDNDYEIEEIKSKKITITRVSKIILIFFLVLLFIMILSVIWLNL